MTEVAPLDGRLAIGGSSTRQLSLRFGGPWVATLTRSPRSAPWAPSLGSQAVGEP